MSLKMASPLGRINRVRRIGAAVLASLLCIALGEGTLGGGRLLAQTPSEAAGTQPPNPAPPGPGQPKNPKQAERQAANKEKNERPRIQAMIRERIKNKLENARALVKKLEEAQKLADSGGDPRELEKQLGEIGRLSRIVGEPVRPGANLPGAKLPEIAGLEGDIVPGNRQLSAAELVKVREQFQQADPELYKKLVEKVGEKEETMNRVLGMVAPRVRALTESMATDDQKMTDLRRDELGNTLALLEAAKEVAESGTSVPTERREKLRKALGRQFDIRLQMQEHQMSQLSDRVKTMKENLERIKGQRDKVLDEKAQAMMKGTRGPGGAGKDVKAGQEPGKK